MTKYKPPNVLIVDDQEDAVVCFRAMFEPLRYQIDTFTDPQQALDNFSSKRYDIVITDVKMPKLTGLELARRINEIDKDTRL